MKCVLHVWVLAQSRAKKYCHIPIFKNHSWQKCPNPAYFIMKTPLYCLTPLFFRFCPTSPLLSPQTPTPIALSVVLFFWPNEWSRHIWCDILLNDIMDPHISNLGTSVPEGPWCVFYATKRQVYWGLTHMIFCWHSDDITHIQTHRHTVHSEASRLTHPYNYIFTPPVMCSQQRSLLHRMNISLISKIYFPHCRFFSKIVHW